MPDAAPDDVFAVTLPPRPYPPMRRTSSRSIRARSIGTPAGRPSRITVRAGP